MPEYRSKGGQWAQVATWSGIRNLLSRGIIGSDTQLRESAADTSQSAWQHPNTADLFPERQQAQTAPDPLPDTPVSGAEAGHDEGVQASHTVLPDAVFAEPPAPSEDEPRVGQEPPNLASDAGSVEVLLRDYATWVVPKDADAEVFASRYRPCNVTRAPLSDQLEQAPHDAASELWIIAWEAKGILLPGPDLIRRLGNPSSSRDDELMHRLSPYFDFIDSTETSIGIVAPAQIVRIDDNTFKVTGKGKLTGIAAAAPEELHEGPVVATASDHEPLPSPADEIPAPSTETFAGTAARQGRIGASKRRFGALGFAAFGGVLIIGFLVFHYFNSGPSPSVTGSRADSRACSARMPEGVQTLYAMRPATRVHSHPSATAGSGSVVAGYKKRGEPLTGTWVPSPANPDDCWLKLGDRSGYVSEINLSSEPPAQDQTAGVQSNSGTANGNTSTSHPDTLTAPNETRPTPPPPATYQTSFDCTLASLWSEKAICADPVLARLDRAMASRYRARLSDLTEPERAALREQQRSWLESRENCSTSNRPPVCLKRAYQDRIRALSSAPPPPVEDQTNAHPSVSGAPAVLDTATLRVDGVEVHLNGIVGQDGSSVDKMRAFIAEQGGTVDCTYGQADYTCKTSTGHDLGAAALLNGAARAARNASFAYHNLENQARQAGRGIWATTP